MVRAAMAAAAGRSRRLESAKNEGDNDRWFYFLV
jgi:hypothetical protein